MYTRPQLSPLCLQVDHSIVSACYPGSFISSILLVVAVYIHRNFTGRELINIFNTLGFSGDISSAYEHCIHQTWPRLSSAEIRTIVQNMQQKFNQASCESVTPAISISPGSSVLLNSLAIGSFIYFAFAKWFLCVMQQVILFIWNLPISICTKWHISKNLCSIYHIRKGIFLP